MELVVNTQKEIGRIKPMNAVNNGPAYKRKADQAMNNLNLYREANIPYARNHDAAFCAVYGGEHTVDVIAVFPDFDADPEDPASYDFHLTDEYVESTALAGTETFYRLGNKIEHWTKKYGTLPPKDFKKWAVICEHIIRHYTEGWADGFRYEMKYWEIWNEPDLDPDDAEHKRTWGGTRLQFYDFYTVAATHLKQCFPHLKIGGPAVATVKDEWCRGFFRHCRDHHVPLDFFSWHIYATGTEKVLARAQKARDLLDEYGFTETESVLNEWNYVKGWYKDEFKESLRTIRNVKGAVFAGAVMAACQNAPVDLLMYYDARPCNFNGLFDAFHDPLPGYYVFKAWGDLLKKGSQRECLCTVPDVYAVTAADGDGNALTVVIYYRDDADGPVTFPVQMPGWDGVRILRLEETQRFDRQETVYFRNGSFFLTLQANTEALLIPFREE